MSWQAWLLRNICCQAALRKLSIHLSLASDTTSIQTFAAHGEDTGLSIRLIVSHADLAWPGLAMHDVSKSKAPLRTPMRRVQAVWTGAMCARRRSRHRPHFISLHPLWSAGGMLILFDMHMSASACDFAMLALLARHDDDAAAGEGHHRQLRTRLGALLVVCPGGRACHTTAPGIMHRSAKRVSDTTLDLAASAKLCVPGF